MISHIEEEFEKLSLNFIQLKAHAPVINEAANICIQALKNGNKILFCGNGGSAADSQHLAAELVCKYKKERAALEAIALTTIPLYLQPLQMTLLLIIYLNVK